MKSYTATALVIASKIWIITLLINTIADTLLLGNFSEDFMGIFSLIGLLGGVFSAPIFLVLWGIIYAMLKGKRNADYILKWLLIAGVSMAVAAWGVFTGFFRHVDSEIFRLIIVAPLSGTIGIFISYPGLKKACLASYKNKVFPENFDAEQMISH